MALNQSYHNLWFVSFRLRNTSGHREPIQLRLRTSQYIPAEIVAECKARQTKPNELLTECNLDYLTKYPAGTRFHLKAKLTDREGGTMFFYSHYSWPALIIVKPKQLAKKAHKKVCP